MPILRQYTPIYLSSGYWLSQLVMPSQFLHKKSSYVPRSGGKRISINSTHGAKIDGIQFSSGSQKQKVIIHAVGNGDSISIALHQQEYDTLAQPRNDCYVVGFNFRNVGLSTGKPRSEQDWIDDAKAVIRHYEAQGISLDNILLSGHSLGGAILTLAAAQIYQEELKKAKQAGSSSDQVKCVKLINNRSFSTLPKAALYMVVLPIFKNFVVPIYAIMFGLMLQSLTISILVVACTLLDLLYFRISAQILSLYYIEKLLALLILPIVSLVLWSTLGWMDALSAYKSLPAANKDYLVAKHDGIIHHNASLATGLKSLRQAEKRACFDRLRLNPNDTQAKDDLKRICSVKILTTHCDPLHAPLASKKMWLLEHKPTTGQDVYNAQLERLLPATITKP